MRPPRWALLAALSTPFAVVACADIFGFERLTFTATEAGPSATTSTSVPPPTEAGPPPPLCASGTRPPSRPDAGDAGADDPSERLTVAFERFDLGVNPAENAAIGFDLDGVCTVDPPSSSCRGTTSATDFGAYLVDKPGGVDNTAFELLKLLGAYPDNFGPVKIQSSLRQGKFGFVLDIRGYNGAPNDPTVGVAFRPTLGLTDGGAPAFDGADEWLLDEDLTNASDFFASTMIDPRAYVRDGVLVAAFSELVLPVQQSPNGNVLRMTLDDAVVTAKIARADGGARVLLVDGVIAGRWPLAKTLDQIRNFAFDPEQASPLCAQPGYDEQFRRLACVARDIHSTVGQDAQAPCDAISVGIGFNGSQTRTANMRERRAYREALCPRVDCDTPLDAGYLPKELVPLYDASPDAPTD